MSLPACLRKGTPATFSSKLLQGISSFCFQKRARKFERNLLYFFDCHQCLWCRRQKSWDIICCKSCGLFRKHQLYWYGKSDLEHFRINVGMFLHYFFSFRSLFENKFIISSPDQSLCLKIYTLFNLVGQCF